MGDCLGIRLSTCFLKVGRVSWNYTLSLQAKLYVSITKNLDGNIGFGVNLRNGYDEMTDNDYNFQKNQNFTHTTKKNLNLIAPMLSLDLDYNLGRHWFATLEYTMVPMLGSAHVNISGDAFDGHVYTEKYNTKITTQTISVGIKKLF